MTSSGPYLYYHNSGDASVGDELWKTDGQPGASALVKDIKRTPRSGDPQNMIDVGGTLYFTGVDAAAGRELWKSDGTRPGTMRVKDITPGTASSALTQMVNAQGTLYFAVAGRELWKSDGTEAGTVKVFTSASTIAQVTAVGSRVYFQGNDGVHGVELWMSDGVGASMVKDLRDGTGPSNPFVVGAIGQTLIFTANTPGMGYELWRTDGTETGTALVKEIYSGDDSGASAIGMLAPQTGSQLIFYGSDGTGSGWSLWRTDGTEAGTTLFFDTTPWPFGVDIEAQVGGSVVFRVYTGLEYQLWCSDGTPSGTLALKQPLVNGDFQSLAKAGGPYFYYLAHSADGLHYGLWRSNVTVGGAELVDALSDLYEPVLLLATDDQIYFKATTVPGTIELFSLDVSGGTRRQITNFPGSGPSLGAVGAAGDKVFFSAATTYEGRELYVVNPDLRRRLQRGRRRGWGGLSCMAAPAWRGGNPRGRGRGRRCERRCRCRRSGDLRGSVTSSAAEVAAAASTAGLTAEQTADAVFAAGDFTGLFSAGLPGETTAAYRPRAAAVLGRLAWFLRRFRPFFANSGGVRKIVLGADIPWGGGCCRRGTPTHRKLAVGYWPLQFVELRRSPLFRHRWVLGGPRTHPTLKA